MIALLYFKQQSIDVALLEVGEFGIQDPVTICNPKILAITRVTDRSCALPSNDNKSDDSS